MDYVTCECGELEIATRSICSGCSENLLANTQVLDGKGTRRLVRGTVDEVVSELINEELPFGLKLSSVSQSIVLVLHYFCWCCLLLCYLWPIYIHAPLVMASFFLTPAALFPFALQATDLVKSVPPKDNIEIKMTFGYLVLGFSLLTSAFLAVYLGINEPEPQLARLIVFGFPVLAIALYKLLSPKPRAIFSKRGLRIKGRARIIPRSEIVTVYGVAVSLPRSKRPASKELRVKLITPIASKIPVEQRGDTLIINVSRSSYGLSELLHALESQGYHISDSLTELWEN